MDKKVINEEQFKKLVINEAKKIMSEGEVTPKNGEASENKPKRFSFDKVEALINEMENMNKSITAINKEAANDSDSNEDVINEEEVKNPVNRDTDMDEYNKKKNVLHMNEGEKDKWKRMMGYEIPKDEER